MEIDEQLTRPAAHRAKEQRGIHAMELGGALLRHLADAGRPLSGADLSAAANVPLNQVFTYMVSLVRSGLVRRDAVTHRYEPGPLSFSLGLHALTQLSPLRETLRCAAALASGQNQAALVAIWADRGPTVVQYFGPDIYVNTGMHVGTVMSIAHSSTGRLFAAWMPKDQIAEMLARDMARRRSPELGTSQSVTDELLHDIRSRGLARTLGVPIPGVDSLSVPIFDRDRSIAVALTVYGPSGKIDVEWEGEVARRLSALSATLSLPAAASVST